MDVKGQNTNLLEELALKAKAEDKQSQEHLIKALAEYIHKVMQLKLGYVREEILDDLVALTIANIWQNFASWEPTKGSFRVWINRIIHYKYVDYIRDEVRERKYVESQSVDELTDPAHTPKIDPALTPKKDSVESELINKELTQLSLVELLGKVEEVDRFIYLIRINPELNLTFQELTEIVRRAGYDDLSTKAVEQRFYKTRKMLREALGDLLY